METEVVFDLTLEARQKASERIIDWLREHPLGWTAGEIKTYAGIAWPTSTVVDLLEEIVREGSLVPGVPVRGGGNAFRTYRSTDIELLLRRPLAQTARRLLDVISERSETELVHDAGIRDLIGEDRSQVVRIYYAERKSSPGWRHSRYFIVNGRGQLEDITRTLADMFCYRMTSGRHPAMRLQLGAADSAENTLSRLGDWLRTFAPYAKVYVISEDVAW